MNEVGGANRFWLDAKYKKEAAQLIRFLVVGLVNTAVGYSFFLMTYLLTNEPNVSVVTAYVFGIIFNFFSTGRLVFGSRRLAAFAPFVLVYALTCGINVIVLDVMARLGVGPLVGQLLVQPLLVMISYALNRFLVFRAPHDLLQSPATIDVPKDGP